MKTKKKCSLDLVCMRVGREQSQQVDGNTYVKPVVLKRSAAENAYTNEKQAQIRVQCPMSQR